MVRDAKSYQINLIRALREKERDAERKKRLTFLFFTGCFGVLILTVLYSGMTVWQMERVLKSEEKKVAYLKNEYRKYASSRLIVDKTDVELLNSLQGKGIFWTKKLAAMAKHLPESYAITRFSYQEGELQVSGWGYVTSKQDQLLILDDYLRRLRMDTTFSDIFKTIYLSRADRQSEDGGNRVNFEFSAYDAARSLKR